MTLIHCQEAIEANQFYQPERKLQRGDVKAMLESADHVIKGSMRLGGQEHLYMETMSCIAIPKGEHREMEILASSQSLSTIQKTVSTALGVPANRIIVKVKRVGKCKHIDVLVILWCLRWWFWWERTKKHCTIYSCCSGCQ